MATLVPARLVPPGRLIKREIDARGWTQKELAEIMGRPVQAITEIVRGTKQITPETAQELAAAFGTSATLWINLETSYRLALAAREQGEATRVIARRSALHSIAPIPELIRRGWIAGADAVEALDQQLRDFLGIDSLDVALPTVSFRQAPGRETDTGALRAWLRRVELLARQQNPAPFSRGTLEAGIPSLLQLTAHTADVARAPEAVLGLGVHIVIVPHLERTFVDGAAFWIDDRPVVALSLRYDRVYYFWMTLLHEIAHILSGHRGMHVDVFEEADVASGSEGDSDEERQADAIARDWLLDPQAFAAFVTSAAGVFDAASVKAFAAAQGRSAGIVCGRLHKDRLVGYEQHRFLLGKVRPHLQPWIDVAHPPLPARAAIR